MSAILPDTDWLAINRVASHGLADDGIGAIGVVLTLAVVLTLPVVMTLVAVMTLPGDRVA